MLCLPHYAYVFSSTKLELRAEQVLSVSEEDKEERMGEGAGRGRNDPNNICTCE
jgi:hypothetical protein